MANLKQKYNRFIFKHRNRGIPNLMLWIVIGNALVYLFEFFSGEGILYSALCFDAALIFKGQVWRLFSYIFINSLEYSNFFFVVIAMIFYHNMGRTLELTWGTLRMNLYYLCGLLLIDLSGILGCFLSPATSIYVSATYLNLSLFLAVATLIPDQRILLFFFIPIRMKWLAFADLILSGLPLLQVLFVNIPLYGFSPVYIFLALFPLVAILNYFLFFRQDVQNVLPDWMARKHKPKPKRVVYTQAQPNPDWAKNYRSSTGEKPYRHKCTVCGRTDTDCPDLEFRYCSKCAGYFCYCIDHINNHNHVE